jgi:pimeloyl-ACP methyl ester carboxylesterase
MKTVEYAGHTLTWEEHSPGEHTFLFLHGWSVGRRTWEPVLEPYKHLGRCVTLDLPGHYPATVPPEYHLSQEQLIDLETYAVRQICGDGPVTLIGHSAGGLVSLCIAARLPHQVRRVVGINSVVWREFSGIVRSTQWLLRNGMYPTFENIWKLTLQDPWTLMNGLSFFVYRQDTFWKNDLAWRLCQDVHEWYQCHSLKNLAVFLEFLDTCDIRPVITSVDVPVLVMVGDRDPVLPPIQSFWLAEHLPHVDLRVFEQTGHIPQIEAPKAFTHVMLDWLTNNNHT